MRLITGRQIIHVPVLLLLLAPLLAGCVGQPLEDPTEPSPTPPARVVPFDIRERTNYPHMITFAEAQQNTLAVAFWVNETTHLQPVARVQANWTQTQAYWIYVDLLRLVTDRFVRVGLGATFALESCRSDGTGSVAGGCPLEPMGEMINARQYARLEPGFYVFLATALGADRSLTEIELLSTEALTVAWQVPLSSDLSYMHGNWDEGVFRLEATRQYDTTSYVLMRIVGRGSSSTFGATYLGTSPAIDFVLERNAVERYVHPDLGMLDKPHFGVLAGEWRFTATGKGDGRPVIGLIGTIHEPPFLRADGTFIPELASGPHPLED